MYCEELTDVKFGIFSNEVPHLLYYSHIPNIVVSLLLAFLVIRKASKRMETKILLGILSIFSLWMVADIFLWIETDSRRLMFVWSFWFLIFGIIAALLFYFFYVFVNKRDLSFSKKIIVVASLLPLVLTSGTRYSLSEFYLYSCNASEHWFSFYYSFVLSLVYMSIILVLTTKIFFNKNNLRSGNNIFVSLGILFFMAIFIVTTSISTISSKFFNDWDSFNYEQYGYLSMMLFLGLLSYSIVKYKSLNIKLLTTQAVTISLSILIGSQFFFIRNIINIYLNLITFVISLIFGYILTRSVKKVDEQRELLARANHEQETLIHFISHQIKGYFTKSRNIFSTILDEKERIPRDLISFIDEGLRSDKEGIKTVEDILNASNLKNGKMEYQKTRIDLIKIIEEVIADNKIKLDAKDLKINFYHADFEKLEIDADSARMKDVFNNLVQNAINYTLKGGINISIEKNANNKTRINIKDTGVGLSEDDKQKLFQSGGRGSEALKYNANSTGYGLFIAKKIAEAHNMHIWAESEGRDKGSKFVIEF